MAPESSLPIQKSLILAFDLLDTDHEYGGGGRMASQINVILKIALVEVRLTPQRRPFAPRRRRRLELHRFHPFDP
jgi:hypothetical protein